MTHSPESLVYSSPPPTASNTTTTNRANSRKQQLRSDMTQPNHDLIAKRGASSVLPIQGIFPGHYLHTTVPPLFHPPWSVGNRILIPLTGKALIFNCASADYGWTASLVSRLLMRESRFPSFAFFVLEGKAWERG